jgi:hypothetical protein
MVRRAFIAVATVLVLLASGCSGRRGSTTDGSTETEPLVGTFKFEAGECTAEGVESGSYFRMAQPGGDPDSGPFVINGDSACGDQTWTPFAPGSDQGLRTADYQPNPDPAFDGGGNAVASRLAQPQKWFAVAFSLSTNEKDPQTGLEVTPPALSASGGRLSGDLRAFSAAWNGQFFNQGAPKPDGSQPGNTSEPVGTYDESSGRFTLDWASQIVGGPFNNFTGKWHLEGIFEPAN